MQKTKNKPIILAMAVVLALATVICGATFAWFTARDSVVNHLETGKLTNGDVEIIEVWDPEDGKDWTPNTEVNKDVGAINTGTAPAFVRISFEEVLNKLVDGIPQSMTAPWTSSQTAGGYDTIPQLANTGAYSGWLDVTDTGSSFTSIVGTIPTDVTVVYKESTVSQPGGGTKTVYNFAAYYDLGNGTYQKVDLPDAKVVYTPADAGPPPVAATNVLTLGALQYNVFCVAPEVAADWLTVKHLAADIDVSSVGSPLDSYMNTWALSDDTNEFIRLIFTDAVKTDLLLCDEGDWWYDAASGWFYYIGVLEPGTTTMNNLLDALWLSDLAGSDYSSMTFDLTAKMDAIQAAAEALTSMVGGGWGFTDTSTGSLYDVLTGFLA